MSAKITGAIWELDLPRWEKYVLLALGDHADQEGNNVYPSIALLVWKTGLSERWIQTVMKKFKEQGLLVKTRGASGRGHPTVYRIDLSKGTSRKWVHSSAPIRDEKGAVDDTERVQSRAQMGAVQSRERVHSTAPEPNTRTVRTKNGGESEAPPPSTRTADEGFAPGISDEELANLRWMWRETVEANNQPPRPGPGSAAEPIPLKGKAKGVGGHFP